MIPKVYLYDESNLIPKKYYHDRELIDWNNLDKSNNEYVKRFKELNLKRRTFDDTHDINKKKAIIESEISTKYTKVN